MRGRCCPSCGHFAVFRKGSGYRCLKCGFEYEIGEDENFEDIRDEASDYREYEADDYEGEEWE